MNWRGLVLLGLVAVAAVEAKNSGSRALKGYGDNCNTPCEVKTPCAVQTPCAVKTPCAAQSSHNEDHWSEWETEEWDAKWHAKWPQPCSTPSPACVPASPAPTPAPPKSPVPSPVAAVSPPPSGPCKAGDWKCANCYMYAKGDMDLFSKCYDCYTAPNQKDDSCAQCTWTYVSDKPTAYKCLADVKAGCPYWAWDSCKQKSKGDDKYMTSCVNCILGTQQKRAVKDDYSGCTMCADACSDATKMGSCSACWLAGGNNYYCSKCQTSAMGADQCYSCLTSKGPFTWDCVK